MITLLNFKTCDIKISYPLVYLHGVSQGSTGELVCQNKTNNKVTKWPVINNEFKAYLFLKIGLNYVVLTDANNELELKIEFGYHHHDEDKTERRYVLPVYIICDESGGTFISPSGRENSVEDAIVKVKFNCRLMQTFFAESLYEHGFDRKTFVFEENEHGGVEVVIFHSRLKLNDTINMTPDDLYRYFNKEISTKFGTRSDTCKYLCFMSCTRYYAPADSDGFDSTKVMSYVRGHAALGGGNMALFGTGSLHTWANSLEDLYSKFTNSTLIDRRRFFDDSCGRGSYSANYATTLGACVHELGHCFDLAHTPHGIMARGHDDMDFFFIVKENMQSDLQANEVASSTSKTDGSLKYRGAHWHRASAVVLCYHRWLNQSRKYASKPENVPLVSLHPDLLGPYGNQGPSSQKNQTWFSTKPWLETNNLLLTGLVIYHLDYVNGIQFLGAKYREESGQLVCVGEETMSMRLGVSHSREIKTVFRFESPGESIKAIKLRAGAWLDGIQITTNLKSSVWLGGSGGDVVFIDFDNRDIETIIVTAGETVGSLTFKCKSDTPTAVDTTSLFTVSARNGLRLVEFRQEDGEIKSFLEYIKDPPPRFVNIDISTYFTQDKDAVHGMVFDDEGCKRNFRVTRKDLELVSMPEEHGRRDILNL